MINLSFFSKTLYDKCPASWEARYVKHAAGPPIDKRMAYEGSVWHLLMEHWQRLSPDLNPEWLYANLDLYIGLYLQKEHCVFKSSFDQVMAKQKILKMIDGGLVVMKREGILRKGIPEYSCRKAVIGGKVRLNVRIDLILENEDSIDIYDYKGVGKIAGLSYEQLSIYRLAGQQEFGKPVRHTAFIMGLFAELIPYQESIWPVSRVEDEFLQVAEAIERKEFPCKPSSMVCKECPVRGVCKESYNKDVRRANLEEKIEDATRARNQIADLPPSAFRIKL